MSGSKRKVYFERLLAPLEPVHLEIRDFSKAHAGHLEKQAGETHIAIVIVADCFNGKTRLERERIVHACLRSAWQEGLHALTIKAFSKQEFARSGNFTQT